MISAKSSTPMADIRRVLLYQRKKALAFFLLITGSVAAAAFLLPKSYQSEGKLLVRLGRENATLDPTAATFGQQPVVAISQSRENEINSIVEVLQSRMMAEKVVDALGPEMVLDRGKNSGGEKSAVPDPREEAIQWLGERITVMPVSKSNVIKISCESFSPDYSRSIVAKWLDLYQAEHARLNRPRGAVDFFAEQTARLRDELNKKEDELRELKTRTGLASLIDQRKSLVDRVSRLKDELLQSEGLKAESNVIVQHLRSQLLGLPERLEADQTAGFGNEGTDQMRNQLYTLQLRREEAATKYTPEHHVMQQIEQQLAAAQAIVDQQEPDRTQVTTVKNPLFEQTEQILLQEERTVAACTTKAEVLQEQLAVAEQELNALNEHEVQITRLEREIELKQASYRTYATNLEQSVIDQAMETERISNISVIQSASYEPQPIRPRRALLLAFGLLAGLFGGLGLALACDAFNRHLETPQDVEEELELPVLVSVPRLRRRHLAVVPSGNGR
ncbi:MAG: hypothetical protein JW829_03180 [Pirellulales bacterium]|nr:hypothetical protein [Pirellulales bacterium]